MGLTRQLASASWKLRMLGVASVIVLGFAVAGTVATASTPSDSHDDSIQLCVNSASGALRTPTTARPCNTRSERVLTINLEGPPGPQGEPGPRGPAGPQGPAGPPGGSVVAPACDVPPTSAGASDGPSSPIVLTGVTVEVSSSAGEGEPDSAWECVTGGGLNIEIADSSVGTDQSHTTTPGHKYIDDLTLRGPVTSGQSADGSYEVLENGAGKFKIEIDGAPVASANVESITMEDLVIDTREMTTGADWDYRVYGPGDAHYGSITIRSRVGKSSSELYQWWQDAATGKNIRKNISVIALKRDGTEARRYNFLECFPTRWDPGEYSPSSRVAVETVVATCGRIELQSVDGGRQEIADWINETVAGEPWKRTVTVKEILKDGSDGKTFTYLDCFPTRYVFPAFSASGTGNLYEEVHIKPIRLELS